MEYAHQKKVLADAKAAHSTSPASTSSVQSLSHVQLFATPWTAAHQASQTPELAQTDVH